MIASMRASLVDVEKGYNPDQRRYPKGTKQGGKFAPSDDHASAATGMVAHNPKGGDHPQAPKVPGHAFYSHNAVMHPHPDDHGYPVFIRKPTAHGDASAWGAKRAIATAAPGGEMPASLNGVPFKSWTPPKDYDWSKDTDPAIEDHFPDLDVPGGSRPAAGVIIEEPDGRVWLTRPTNDFGGYEHTFPKGGQEKGMSLQETAVKEAWEETGLHVRLTGVVGDFQRTTSTARYYTAERIGGSPSDMGWESQAIRLVPRSKLHDVLNTKADHAVVDALDDLDDIGKAAPDSAANNDVLARALADAFAPTPEEILSERLNRIAKAGAFSEASHPRWPKGTPLGGEFMPKDEHGVPLPPKLGSAKNPEHQAKADAIYGLLKAGDIKNAKAGAAKLNEAADKVKAKLAGGAKPNFHDKNKLKLAQYADAAIKAKEGSDSASVKADHASEKTTGPATLDAYKKTGAKPGGSNPGGLYEKDGAKYLVKGSNHTGGHQAHNEVLAAKLLQASGAGAPDQHVVDLQGQHGGGIGVASKWIDGGSKLDKSNPAHLAAARDDFAAHAWLGNYDAIGQENDNTKIVGGKAVNIDPGGALLYRAQGAAKYADMKMPHTVGEWNTLRDPKVNAQAASVYGGMTHSQLQASAAKLKDMTDEKIGHLVDTYGPKDAKIAADLKTSLSARRDDILKKAGLSEPVKPSAAEQLAGLQNGSMKIGGDGKIVQSVHGATFGPGNTPKTSDFIGTMPEMHAASAKDAADMHAMGNAEWLKAKVDYHQSLVDASAPGGNTNVNNTIHVAHESALLADLNTKSNSAPRIPKVAEVADNAAKSEIVVQPTFSGKSADFWQKKADAIADDHAHGVHPTDLTEPYTPVSGKMSPNAVKLHAYHAAVKDKLEKEWGEAAPTEEQTSNAINAVQPAKADDVATASGVKSALPDFEAHKLPESNTNAASHNAKIDAIAQAAKDGDHKSILAMKFGTNTYAKKQVKIANDALKGMGVHDVYGVPAVVEAGQKANTHPALTGGMSPSKVAAAAKNAGTPVTASQMLPNKPKIVPKLAKSDMSPFDYKGAKNGAGLSSKPHVNEQNDALQAKMMGLAQRGDMAGLKAMTYHEIDKDSGERTGKVLPIDEHPAKGIQNFHSTLLGQMEAIANPPKPLRSFTAKASTSIAEINSAFPHKPLAKLHQNAEANTKLGQWYVALGKTDPVDAVTPTETKDLGPVKTAHAAYKNMSQKAKQFITNIQSSGSMNQAFVDGKKVYNGQDLHELAVAATQAATVKQAGTKLTKWIPTADIQALMKAEPGTVLQSAGSMCASYEPNLYTKNFGGGDPSVITFIHAEGAKSLDTYGSGAHQSEKEISVLPNSKFILLKKEDGGPNGETSGPFKANKHITLLILPPDPALSGGA